MAVENDEVAMVRASRTGARHREGLVRRSFSFGGGHGDASNARNLPEHAATAAAFGLPRDEALKAVTLYPAQILGVADRLGSIEPGKIADTGKCASEASRSVHDQPLASGQS